MSNSSILFSEMTPASSWEAEFNAWYDGEHIPLRMAVPGFTSAQRYKSTEDGSYLAVYEMQSLDVLKTAAYGKVKNEPSATTARMLRDVSGFTRYLGDEIFCRVADHAGTREQAVDAACLYAVFFDVPADREQAFDDWYEHDHVPILLDCKDWLMCRRFRVVDGSPRPWTHMALHYLNDPSALESPERARARATPWRAKLAAEPWFKASYLVFSRVGVRQRAT